jgi:hypothetical protein
MAVCLIRAAEQRINAPDVTAEVGNTAPVAAGLPFRAGDVSFCAVARNHNLTCPLFF